MSVPSATHRRRGAGAVRITTSPCKSRMRRRCSGTSPTRASATSGLWRVSFAGTITSSSRLRVQMAASRNSRSSTPSVSIRCSSIWCGFPADACSRSPPPGTVGRARRADNAGSISTPTNPSRTTTCCIGAVASRTGIRCAPTATRRGCARATIRRRTPTTPRGRSSTSPAKPATARARTTWPGRARGVVPAMTVCWSISSPTRARAGNSCRASRSQSAAARHPAASSSVPALVVTRGAVFCVRRPRGTSHFSTPIGRRSSTRRSTPPTGRSRMRSTSGAPSCRAACSPPA